MRARAADGGIGRAPLTTLGPMRETGETPIPHLSRL